MLSLNQICQITDPVAKKVLYAAMQEIEDLQKRVAELERLNRPPDAIGFHVKPCEQNPELAFGKYKNFGDS